MEYKKIRFLQNRSANILVRNVSLGKNVQIESNKYGKWFIKSEHCIKKEIAPMDACFADFLKLGKQLYEINKNNLNKLNFRKASIKIGNKTEGDMICDIRIGYILVNLQNEYNEETKRIIYNYCKGKGNNKNDKYSNTNLLYLVDNDDYPLLPIETNSLIDISIFTYLVICSMINYNNGNYQNGISFETFTNIDKTKSDEFIDAIIFFMNSYEPTSYSPPFTEHTELHYNKETNDVETYRVFDSIFSLYWFILKMQIMANFNDKTFINLCGCGEVILGKDDFCPACKLIHRAKNKNKSRKKLKKQNQYKKANFIK